MILTYNFRIKDSSTRKLLKKMASDTNFVWNFSNNIVKDQWKKSRKYTSKYDLAPLVKGSSEFLTINSQTVQAIAYECVTRTQKAKKLVRFRTAGRNLGWIPINGQTFKLQGSTLIYNKKYFKLWKSRHLPEDAKIKTGNFSQNSEGKWFCNITFQTEVLEAKKAPNKEVALDLGLKTLYTTSDGLKSELRVNNTNKYALKLAKAQRAKKKKQVTKIHTKIKNSRKDWNHKETTKLTKSYNLIFVGDVSSKSLKKTKMAKSVSDAAWYQFKTFLKYKAIKHSGEMYEIKERFSTVTCSVCLSKTGPSGLRNCGVREWICINCNSSHDRDINSAKNILRFGHETLNLKGIPRL